MPAETSRHSDNRRRHDLPWHKPLLTALTAALLGLSACGGGGGGSPANTSAATADAATVPPATLANPVAVTAAPLPLPTRAQAARFLTQATFGPTPAAIDRLVEIGYERWLDEQFAVPQTLHQPAVQKFGDPISPKFFGFYPIQSTFWRQAATAPDALRQRVMFALSEIFVVSINDMAVIEHPRGVAAFMDTLARGAFSTYRQLLEDVSLHPMMGLYLSHLGNQKEDAATGRVPDENFAREVMQLFSIGVDQLDANGTVRRDGNGRSIETYGNEDVIGLAKVFTGWSWHAPQPTDAFFFAAQPIPLFFSPDADPDRDVMPMRLYPQFHSASEKRFLGTVVPAGTDGTTSLRIALDRLAAHANVGPFLGRQLIQRLVTSNPSPAYVQRVSQAFANNGNGARGDMKAVLRAVLLDPEALTPPAGDGGGKVREPVLRVTAWMRAFNVKSNSGNWAYYFNTDPVSSIGQSPMQAPSVFNFFRPGYVPPRSEIGAAGGVAPEMQIVGETTVASYLNVIEGHVGYFGSGFLFDLSADYAAEVALADEPDRLIERIDLLLTYGQMSAASKALIREAVAAVPSGSYLWRENRARLAVQMALSSPDFIVQQ